MTPRLQHTPANPLLSHKSNQVIMHSSTNEYGQAANGILDSLSLGFFTEILMQALPCSLFSTGKAARGLIFLFTVGRSNQS